MLEGGMIQGGANKINENEKKKFKEYREGQLKQREEQKKKKMMLEAKKKEDDELLTKEKQYNDVQTELVDKKKIISKLNEKIKFLDSEIRDLKYENERDKEDMTNENKELSKENKLYYGILRMVLTENEIKKIIDFSTWKEEKEEWKIHPFTINPKDKNQTLKFPDLKQHQINDFLENEFQGRDFVLGGDKNGNGNIISNKVKITVKGNNIDSLSETKNGFKITKTVMNNNNNNNVMKDIENRAYKNIKNNIRYDEQDNQENTNGNPKNFNKNTVLEPINPNKKLQMKEQKKFEDILKNTPINLMNELSNSLKKQQQGKVVLDPINPEYNGTKNKFFNNKKIDVSFKATFQIRDEIEISPKKTINPKVTNLGGKKLAKLEKIPEIKDNNYDNFDQD